VRSLLRGPKKLHFASGRRTQIDRLGVNPFKPMAGASFEVPANRAAPEKTPIDMPIPLSPTETCAPSSSAQIRLGRVRADASMRYAGRVTLLDRLYQVGYRLGYQLVRLLWLLLRPTTHGALVVVWKEGSLLLVRNSYVSYFSPPGGYVRGGETAKHAALRELEEETGLKVAPDQLKLCHEETHNWEFKRDHVTMFDVEVVGQVDVHVDHREVIAAGFYAPEEALTLNLFPPLRRRLEKYIASRVVVAAS